MGVGRQGGRQAGRQSGVEESEEEEDAGRVGGREDGGCRRAVGGSSGERRLRVSMDTVYIRPLFREKKGIYPIPTHRSPLQSLHLVLSPFVLRALLPTFDSSAPGILCPFLFLFPLCLFPPLPHPLPLPLSLSPHITKSRIRVSQRRCRDRDTRRRRIAVAFRRVSSISPSTFQRAASSLSFFSLADPIKPQL